MNKKLFTVLGILFIISLSIFIFGTLYQNELPKFVEQINNSSIGAILMAIITVLLLSQQSSSEEVKERNVKVFEKKSEVFNNFIEQLWAVWEDRTVSLEELNGLIKIVAKNIIPYAKPETSKSILQELNKIADKINFDKSDNTDETTTKQIQNSIFSIINTIANEMGLGGKIDEYTAKELVALENRVLPVLNKKNFSQRISKLVSEKSGYKLCDFILEDDVLWWQIEKTDVWLAVGLVDKVPYITFWTRSREFDKYRYAQKGKFKEWLLGYEKFELFDLQEVNNSVFIPNDSIQQLGEFIINFYEEKEIAEEKTIRKIIEECLKQ
jgi:hypothetical protein